jgi:hypothetical protein
MTNPEPDLAPDGVDDEDTDPTAPDEVDDTAAEFPDADDQDDDS